MKPPDRFSINELGAQYQYHPDLRDIYVEGRQDRVFLEWFLNAMGLSTGVAIYESQAVDVGADVLQRHDISESGERARLIALSRELCALLKKGHKHLMVIVDGDFDYILDSVVRCDLLFYTDGTSLESYFVCHSALKKLFDLALRDFSLEAKGVLHQMLPILIEIFVLRATNERLGWKMSWVPFAGCCSVAAEGTLNFKKDVFMRSYLSKNGRLGMITEFASVYSELRARVGTDYRRFVRGHDFAELLSIAIRRHLHHDQRNFRDPNVLEGTLFTCLEVGRVRDEPLLKTVVARMVPEGVSQCTTKDAESQ